MAQPETRFYGKTWIYRAQAIIFGSFTIFGSIMGPLFLSGTEGADGKPRPEAGIGLTAVTLVIMLPAFVVAVFNLRARRLPLIRLCREGLVARLIGQTAIDRVPLVPELVRLLWGFLSMQSLRHRSLCVGWPDLINMDITGLPALYVLSIRGVFREHDQMGHPSDPSVTITVFQQADFRVALQAIADAISFYKWNEPMRGKLPSWSEPVWA
jgi:hypothetical protein